MAVCFPVIAIFIAWRYFPASGDRQVESGKLVAMGAQAFCRSSSPVGAGNAQSGNLSLGSATLHPLSINSRGAALPVRCVQELTKHFLFIIISPQSGGPDNHNAYLLSPVRLGNHCRRHRG